jgi:hypothetical protein
MHRLRPVDFRIGDAILEAYGRALEGVRATKRGEEPIKPTDPYLLRDLTTILYKNVPWPQQSTGLYCIGAQANGRGEVTGWKLD